MKTNELIKHLRFCADMESLCTACNRYDDMGIDGGTHACVCDLMQQAANAIEELQTQLRDEMHRHDRLQDFEVAEAQDLAAVKAERDAMLAEMKHDKGCAGCEHCDIEWYEEPCDSCRKDPKSPAWKWRGRS
jgi:hypothetical protein